MAYPWAPYQRPLAVEIAISTADPIRLDFPPDRYLASRPIVLVTVNGGRTEVTVTSVLEAVAGFGEMFTHVSLQFPADLVGKRVAIWVMGE